MSSASVPSSPIIKLYRGHGRGREYRSVDQLLYLRSEQNYTWLVWTDGEQVLIPRTLNYFQLPASWFIRLHRNCLANRGYVTGLKQESGGYVACLCTGEQLPISRRRLSRVRQSLREPYTPP